MTLELHAASARHPAARPAQPLALRGLTVRVQSGEQLAVIGPSGAGKTTLLHLLACAMTPQTGTLTVDGANVWQLPRPALQALRGTLFLAPQVPPLPPRQRVITAVLAGRLPAMGLWDSLTSLVKPREMALAHEALSRFDLGDKLFERVDRLSGGERQRVGLARALLAPARLWLVDEPLSALDPTRALQAMTTLVGEARRRGVTLVTTLHQVDMALAHFPRIVGLRDGALVFDLPTARVGPDRLARLYAQHEDELHGRAPAPEAEPLVAASPAATHCR